MKKYTKDECYKTYSNNGKKVRYWNPKLINIMISVLLVMFGILTFVMAKGESNTFGFMSIVIGLIIAIIPVGTKVKTKK